MLALFQQIRHFHKVSLEADFERPIAVNRNGNTDRSARLGVDVMAAIDPQKPPAVALDQAREFAA